MKKYIAWFLAFAIVVTISFIFNSYTSSPGFTTQEYFEEFEKNKPRCYGISLLLNMKQTWVDGPGRSVCIWFLKRK